MKKNIFKGVSTALITPFYRGDVDYVALEALLDKQIEAQVDAITILGTTGEPATLSQFEKKELIKKAVTYINGRAKVIVGCGANNTAEAINNYNIAEELGADASLIVTPYYNKCTQQGLVEHYKSIAGSGNLPIIVYNVPGRTGVNITAQTMLELSNIQNVCGVKESSGNISQILDYFRLVGDRIDIYSGEDSLNGLFLMLGGSGIISVLSNVLPKYAKKIANLYMCGQIMEANKRHLNLLPLINSLFLEVNPIPVKAALSYLGLCKNEVRLPLTKITQENFEVLKREIDKVWVNES